VRALFLSAFILSSGLLSAQIPRIGVIDYYGIRKVPDHRIQKALALAEGDRLPASKSAVEDRLEQVAGVVLARLDAVCCRGAGGGRGGGGGARGAPHFDFREPPTGDATLPEELTEAYRGYLRAFAAAARAGHAEESFYHGHPLAEDAAARAYQERFPGLAKTHLAVLRRVLKESGDAGERAIAAAVIGYVPDKEPVINDLQFAMQDADESVRANAMRALSAAAVLGARDPETRIHVRPTWFIEMLNSLVWGDRLRSSTALVHITEKRDAAMLDELRERALPALTEMARWKTLAHALPAFLLVGRIQGIPEPRIYEAWNKGDRDAVLGNRGK
jgi:hypothetical protein